MRHPRVALLIAVLCFALASIVCNRDNHAPASGPRVTAPAGAPDRSPSHGAGVPPLPDRVPGGPIATVVDGPSGSTGTNGLHPDVYHRHKVDLTRLMDGPLVRMRTNKLASGFDDILDGGTREDEKLVGYTLDCALQGGTFVTPSKTFSSNTGLLTTTGNWTDAGLNLQAQEDLHTCLATRLNPSEQEVRIWLVGEHVPRRVEAGEYAVEEAYWAAKLSRNLSEPIDININVWPSPTIVKQCAQASAGGIVGALSRRICGTPAGRCGLTQHDDWGRCTGGDGGTYRCSLTAVGSPTQQVIKTQMSCKDWCTIYPDCFMPKECAGADFQRCPDGGTP